MMDPQNIQGNISHEEMETLPEEEGQLSPIELIKTLELQGSILMVHVNKRKAFRKWKKAFFYRKIHSMPRDADRHHHFGIYTPFKSVEELKERRLQKKYMMFEALNTYIRWWSVGDIMTIQTAVEIAEEYMEDDYITNELLIDLFRFNWETWDPIERNAHFLLQGMIRIRSSNKVKNFNFLTAAKEISMYMDYTEEKIWSILAKLKFRQKKQRKTLLLRYKHVTFYLLKYFRSFLEAGPPCEVATPLLSKLQRLISEERRRNLPTTLLHQAVKASYPFGVELLVQCGADINAPDYRNNIPLHLNIFKWESYNKIASYLVRNGSEVDTKNYSGRSVQTILQERKILKNELENVTLKCLAARAISKYSIGVKQDECPENLLHTIKIHGGHIVKKD